MLGTVDATDGRQLTVADVPGLIEGASEGVGLGHEFLAHLERARLLLHVIDATEDAPERFAAIDRELERYGAGLESRPQVVVLNKIDLLSRAAGFDVDDPRIVASTRLVRDGRGIEEFKRGLFELCRLPCSRRRPTRARRLSRLPAAAATRARLSHPAHRPRLSRRGNAPDEAELEQALRAAGARTGAEVEVGEETFELA